MSTVLTRPEDTVAIAAIAAEIGPPLVLINNAGLIDQAARIEETTDALWDSEFAVHTAASFYLTRGVFPLDLTVDGGLGLYVF